MVQGALEPYVRRPTPRASAFGPVSIPMPVRSSGDPARLQQVVWNLLDERGQVHARGRPGRARAARAQARTSRSASPTPVRALRPRCCRTCSSASVRPTARARARTAASGWAWRWSSISSSCTAAPSSPRAPDRDRGATFIVSAAGRTADGNPRGWPYHARRRARPPPIDRLGPGPPRRPARARRRRRRRGGCALVRSDPHAARAPRSARAMSAAEALDLLREWRPDVLVSDIEMPGRRRLLADSQGSRPRALTRGARTPAIALTRLRPAAGPAARARRRLQHARPEAGRSRRAHNDHRRHHRFPLSGLRDLEDERAVFPQRC